MFEQITNFVPGGMEIVLIIVIIGVLIFGGKAKGDYEKGKIESEKDLKDFKDIHDSK